MKRFLIVCTLVLLGLQGVKAQSAEYWYPRQFGIGVGVGTTGVVIDASTTINRWFGIRAGVDLFPNIKMNTDLDLNTEDADANWHEITQIAQHVNDAAGSTKIDLSDYPDGMPRSMDVQGKWKNTTFHFLVDVYPFKNSSFHATTGFYIGGKDVVSVYNRDEGFLKPVTQWNYYVKNLDELPIAARHYMEGQQMIGAELGDYFITPDPADGGNVEAKIKVSGFRPYIGVGYGRAVPRKNRIGVQYDFGLQFWNTPKVYAPTYSDENGYRMERLTDDHAGEDGGGIIKTISKISVYPTLNIRLVGRFL